MIVTEETTEKIKVKSESENNEKTHKDREECVVISTQVKYTFILVSV